MKPTGIGVGGRDRVGGVRWRGRFGDFERDDAILQTHHSLVIILSQLQRLGLMHLLARDKVSFSVERRNCILSFLDRTLLITSNY